MEKRAPPRFNLEMASFPGGKRPDGVFHSIRNKKCGLKMYFNRWWVCNKSEKGEPVAQISN
jgi:hypothetical protein